MFEKFESDIRELKARAKVWGVSFIAATLFFLVFPANLNSNLLGFYKPVVSLLLDMIKSQILPSSVQLIPGTLSAPIMVYTYASLFFGFLVSAPILFYETYAFIRPALGAFPNKIIWLSYILFMIGCAFGFFVLMPAVMVGLVAFFPYVGVSTSFIDVIDFYKLVFLTVLVSGLTFLTPIVIYLITKYLGFDVAKVTKNRKYLWAFVYIGSAVITPDSNILADFILFIPLILMIEVSLFFASRSKRLKK